MVLAFAAAGFRVVFLGFEITGSCIGKTRGRLFPVVALVSRAIMSYWNEVSWIARRAEEDVAGSC